MSKFSPKFLDREPNIRKATFILQNESIYILEFDENIEMKELKSMIQKAAHLQKNSFNLFSEGIDYTQYNEEIFGNIFPHQYQVEFNSRG